MIKGTPRSSDDSIKILPPILKTSNSGPKGQQSSTKGNSRASDLYVFKDASGTINVDIDHKRWNGVTVTPKDTVEIQGEVDKDWNSVEIDVKQIRKVNP